MRRAGASAAHRPSALRAAGVVLVVAGVAALLAQFPVNATALGAGLLLAAALVAWRPLWLWAVLPAALPLLDWAPWTGWLFLDEYDALLALLLAVAWWRTPTMPAAARDGPLRWALLAVGASLLLSSVRALQPWPALDANAFASLTSPFNALRVVRGAVWGFLLLALAQRQQAAGWAVSRHFGAGMVLGLLGTVAFILDERIRFSHLLDFSDSYRVSGPFSAMHTGGAYVECFLIITLPFLLARLWPPVAAWRLVAGSALLVGALYSVMVTFSRGGYAALLLSLALSMVLAWRLRRNRKASTVVAAALALLTAAVTTPVLLGSFAQSRLAAVDSDLRTRQGHWAHVLHMVGGGLPAWAVGMGVGRFPALDLLNSGPEHRSASYRLVQAAGSQFLRLGTGQALYIEQSVQVQPEQAYQLRVRLRAAAPGATLVISLCEKWLLTSATCVSTAVAAHPAGPDWIEVSQTLRSGAVGAALPGRPVRLSFNAGGGAGAGAVDLASIQLSSARGKALLQNSQFDRGMDHWFFTADQHLAWHTKSMPLGIFFDQGLFGLASLGALLALALARAGRAAWAGTRDAAPLVAALVGFSTVGLVDTLIDAPRFLMIWLLLCGLAASQRPPPDARG